MKNLFVALIMLTVFTGCAGISQKCATTLPKEPTHEDVLYKVRADVEKTMFNEWWEVEKEKFTAFVSMQVNAKATVTTEEIIFLGDFQIAVVRISVSAPIPDGQATMHLIVTRPDGTWRIVNVVVPPLSTEGENEQKL